MGRAVIRAITFDLWDTVLIDDSDEPKRAAQGLASKPDARRNLVCQFLARHKPISAEQVDLAYNTVDAAFRQVWYGQNVTWTVRQRLSVLLDGLGRHLCQAQFDELARLHEEMELEVRPDLAVGAVAVSEEVAAAPDDGRHVAELERQHAPRHEPQLVARARADRERVYPAGVGGRRAEERADVADDALRFGTELGLAGFARPRLVASGLPPAP